MMRAIQRLLRRGGAPAAMLERLIFRLRTRRLARELDIALAIRRRGRAARKAAARKGVATKFQRRMEGLR